MKSKIIGIDLGSSNLIIYIPSKGIIFNEPSVVAINKQNNKVYNVGYLALKLLGKETDNIEVYRPIKKGVIHSIEKLTKLIQYALKTNKVNAKNHTLLVSSPSEISEVETLAIKKLAKNLEASGLEIQSQTYLSLLGSLNSSSTSRGNFVVTLGGGCSDIAVFSGTKLLISKTSTFSGTKLDEAISRHLRKKHHILIGEKTSEYIKMKIGSLEQFPENRLLEVSGKDIVTSLPKSVIISTLEIKQTILSCITPLLEAITDCLELTPPEIASDIIESGIVICGGGSLLAGIRSYLESSLNINVRISNEPTYAVINGMKNLIHSLKK